MYKTPVHVPVLYGLPVLDKRNTTNWQVQLFIRISPVGNALQHSNTCTNTLRLETYRLICPDRESSSGPLVLEAYIVIASKPLRSAIRHMHMPEMKVNSNMVKKELDEKNVHTVSTPHQWDRETKMILTSLKFFYFTNPIRFNLVSN